MAWYFNDNYPWLGMLFCAPMIGLWYWTTDQYIVQRALGAPDEREARRGSIAAAFLKGGRPLELLRLDVPGWPDLFPLLLFQEKAARSNLDVLSALEREGKAIPNGLVCAAATGAGFLGRLDRSWRCLPGNLHAVIHLEPRNAPERAGAAFSILAAASCVDALRLSMPEEGEGEGPLEGAALEAENSATGQGAAKKPAPSIKWVNDVCIGKAKIAGFLTRQTYQDPLITGVSKDRDQCSGIIDSPPKI
jgi:hypothetical protein